MQYAMVIEHGEKNYSAYLPDLPGCVVTGKTREEVHSRMAEAIRMHIDGLRADGEPVPQPTTNCEYVSANAG